MVRYDISITSLFDDFFKYQLDIDSIAELCKKGRLDNFEKVLLYIMVCYHQEDMIHGTADSFVREGIAFEFQKALAYHVCRINNTLY